MKQETRNRGTSMALILLWLLRRLRRFLRWLFRGFFGWLKKLTKVPYWKRWMKGAFVNGLLVAGGIFLWGQLQGETLDIIGLYMLCYVVFSWPLVSALRR